MCFTGRVDALARGEAEDDLSRIKGCVWIFAADANRDAWITYKWGSAKSAIEIPSVDAHALKLCARSVQRNQPGFLTQ